MQWRFTIIDRNNKHTIIDEPNGWVEFSVRLKRNAQRHGTFREIQGNGFQFWGKAATLLRQEYQAYGLNGSMQLKIEMATPKGWWEFYQGIFSFPTYNAVYDQSYYIEIEVDQAGPLVDLINRFDQSVDLTKLKSFDGVTDLTDYPFAGFNLILPSKAILLQSEAGNTTMHELNFITDTGWIFIGDGTGSINGSIVPAFDDRLKSGLEPFNPKFALDFYNHSQLDEATQEIIQSTKKTDLNCQSELYDVDFRIKGRFIHGATTNGGSLSLRLELKRGLTTYNDPAGTFIGPGWSIRTGPISGFTQEFDITFTGTIPLIDREKLWLTFFLIYTRTSFGSEVPVVLQMDQESYFKVQAISKCDETNDTAYMINEATSRVIESITDNKLKLYSEYFGRTNSAPFNLPSDGCGAHRVLTSGLQIRTYRMPDGSVPGAFISLKDIFESLAASDNIGMGPEGENTMRIENWKWFYKNIIIHKCLNINKVERSVLQSEGYSTFKCGYEKWEAEDYNGLDEFLTKREYRLDLPQIKNSLEQLCKFIASGYAIEVTRRKGNTSTDWRYDNNIFMICVEPHGASYKVEINNILSPANMVDPASIYNFRLSPVRNAMRWFDRVIGSYRNVNTGHKIIFASSDGNYVAQGELAGAGCKLEAGILKENQSLSLTDFEDQAAALPIMWPERVKFSYPLGANDYKNIQANPYGLIQFTSPFDKGMGWIEEINYRPNEGMADFILIPKIA